MALNDVLAELEILGALGVGPKKDPVPVPAEMKVISESVEPPEDEWVEEAEKEEHDRLTENMIEMTARAVQLLEKSIEAQAELRDMFAELHDMWLEKFQSLVPHDHHDAPAAEIESATAEPVSPLIAAVEAVADLEPEEVRAALDEALPEEQQADQEAARLEELAEQDSEPPAPPRPTADYPGRRAFYEELRKEAANPLPPPPVYQRR
jgi:hypothetical protein